MSAVIVTASWRFHRAPSEYLIQFQVFSHLVILIIPMLFCYENVVLFSFIMKLSYFEISPYFDVLSKT